MSTLLSLPVHRFLLPFRSESPDFHVFTLAHAGANLVLGLIDSHSASLQDEERILSVIDRAAKIVDGDKLALSLTGGFSGTGQAACDAQRRVLEYVANAATRRWGFSM